MFIKLKIIIDLKKIKFAVPNNNPIKVIHAPTRKGIKGTAIIVKTIERLKDEGVKIDFKLLEGIPNEKVLEELTFADIVIDQIYLPGPGTFCIEAMASGCAVATRSMTKNLNIITPPVCDINENNIYERLKFLFTNEEYHLKLAYAGRKYVEEYNTPSKIASQIIQLLSFPNYDYEPSFFLNKYKLPKNYVINKQNLDCTKKILLKYGIPKEVNISKAIEEKLAPEMDYDLISKITIWK